MNEIKCPKNLEKAILGADDIYYKFISGEIDEKKVKESLRKKLEKEKKLRKEKLGVSEEASEKEINEEYEKLKKIYKDGREYAKMFAEYGDSKEEVLDNIKAHAKFCGVCSEKVTKLKGKYMTINLAKLTYQEIENAKYFGLLN